MLLERRMVRAEEDARADERRRFQVSCAGSLPDAPGRSCVHCRAAAHTPIVSSRRRRRAEDAAGFAANRGEAQSGLIE